MRVVVARPTPASCARLARRASRALDDHEAGRPRVRIPRPARRSPARADLRGGLTATATQRAPAAFVATDEPDTPGPSEGDVLTAILRRVEVEGTPLALGRGAWRAKRRGVRRGTSDEPRRPSSESSPGTPRDLLDDDRRFRVHPDARYVLEPGIAPDGGALLEIAGADAVASLCDRFVGVEDRELPRCERVATRVSAVSPTEIVVSWEVRFVPAKLSWMTTLGEVWPGVTVEYYDILDRMDQRSRFTWEGLFRVFQTAALEKKMRVPRANVRGVTQLRFRAEEDCDDARGDANVRARFSLLSTEETIELVGHVNAERVQNKRLARDVLAFLDARKPPNVSIEAWDARVDESVKWRSVPGMGQFDVDGLEDAEDRNEVFADAMVLLAFCTMILLTFAWAFGGWYLHGLERDAAMLAMTRDGFYD